MISCPTCGRDAPDTAVSCAVCATPLPGLDGLTTPPPVSRSPSMSDEAATSAPDSTSATGTSSAPTGFEPRTHLPASGSQAAATASTTRLFPGQTFGQRYQIIKLLGEGGMGAVYHVWDAELNLPLALKVIKPDSDPTAVQELERRFKRELILARQVTHTNVIRIHDLGEIGGVKYITMPFVPGTDLARLLRAEGRLPVARALGFARQVVAGLRAAHQVGVVHRDFKPANILIDTTEKAIITDFGIARSTEAGTLATATGAVVGTLAYMAPEQALGKPVDQRADIYAFGLILSEMLVERRGPTHGETALALLFERARQAPPPLRTIDPSIPEAIDRIVGKCLEPDPAARYQTTDALWAALDRLDAEGRERVEAPQPVAAPVPPPAVTRWPLVAAAAAALVVIAALAWMAFGPDGAATPTAPRDPVSVLVADFDNQAKEPVFEGSLEQALNIAIEGASFITSYSRASAQTLANQLNPGSRLDEAAARLVAAREGIKIILTGVVASRGSGYTLSVKAIDPPTGNVLTTAETTASDKGSVLQGIETIASTLRDALGDTTPESIRRAAAESVTTASLEALQAYSRGQDFSGSGQSEAAIAQFRRAIELDPSFGRAYSGWATELYNNGRRDEAAEQYKKALSLADRMTEREKYRTQGAFFLGPGASYEQAVGHFEELVRRYPADRAGHNNLALAHFNLLDFAKAKEQGLRAVEIYPQNARFRNNYALYAMYSGDLATASAEADQVIAQAPSQYKAYLVKAAAAFVAGDLQTMRQAYAVMAERGGTAGASLSQHGLADLAMYEGRRADAITLLRAGIEADQQAGRRGSAGAKLAMLAEALAADGHTAAALTAARQAIDFAREDATLLPTALIFLGDGREAEAKAVAEDLSKQFQARSRAYGEMIAAQITRAGGRLNDSVDALGRAQKFADLWLGRFMLGVINVEAGRFALAQPDLELCLNRRGEAMALFLDDVPTFRYLVTVPYWLARVQEGQQNSAGAAEHFKLFLASQPGDSSDPLVADARKRLPALKPAS
ncbi:MAG: protein kinase domain-containing protein [Acidobacteriota bacterium]